jgi:Flp pilus assembly protein TadG
MKRTRTSLRGTSAVEFSLVLPLLLMMLLGMIEFARMFYFRQVIVHAVREAGRFGQVGLTNFNSMSYGSVQAAVTQVLYTKSAGLLPSAKATVKFTNSRDTNNSIGMANDLFTIRVDYNYDFISPLGPLVKAMYGGAGVTNKYKLTCQSSFKAEKWNDQF